MNRPEINVSSPEWILIKAYLLGQIGIYSRDLRSPSHDFQKTQLLRGAIAAYEDVLKIEDSVIKNNRSQ